MNTLRYLIALVLGRAHAQVFDGGGLQEGVTEAGNIAGLPQAGIREIVLRYLLAVLNFLALAAVIVVIAAGLFLVLGGGSDTAKDRAKKIVIYVIVGLIVIFFARAIVGFILLIGGA
jgi:type IV secretory pathway VirB2 component (pilin)